VGKGVMTDLFTKGVIKHMVYLALEPAAAAEAIHLSKKAECAAWVGSDAITE
jgi:hypothetical protein